MRTNRRGFLAGAVAAGALASRPAKAAPTVQELDRAAAAPVLRRDGLKSPVIIESMKLLEEGPRVLRPRALEGRSRGRLARQPAARRIPRQDFQAARGALLHRQGRPRSRKPALGTLPLAEQLQDVRTGALEPAGVGRVRHPRHARTNRGQADGRTARRYRAARGGVLRRQRTARHHAGAGNRVPAKAGGAVRREGAEVPRRRPHEPERGRHARPHREAHPAGPQDVRRRLSTSTPTQTAPTIRRRRFVWAGCSKRSRLSTSRSPARSITSKTPRSWPTR